MELKIRKLEESDWDTLVKLWSMWPDWVAHPSQSILPENGTGGLIVEKNGLAIIAGFIYTTNSKIGWMEWIVSNSEYRESDRKEATALLISGLEHVAKISGCEAVISIGKNKSLMKVHESLGYTIDKTPSFEISKKIV
jgi:hypothetical protein|tara:strand:+ start:36 stop:449 length:414 start_codon:yes stop_codon:yes gene_type:complete